ncbi:MAG: diacylglycerol kinase family protein [Candidatus Enteromonas sp.]|nr:diacylglycerol kinase family protein [Candidatus Enteromonas sp.]
MDYLFYNELSDGGRGKEDAEGILEGLRQYFPSLQIQSVTSVNPKEFIASAKKDDNIIIAGGDGTLNHLVNLIDTTSIPCRLYLYPFGTGNDFLNDIKEKQDPVTKLVPLNDYVVNLPYVEVKGKTYRFLNGIGFGIDGECCVVAEKMKAEGKTNISYSGVTIKLLFTSFRPRKATVKVDGKEVAYGKVYLASAMNGRYYGGGMNIAPSQVRGSNSLTSVVINGTSRLGTLFAFPGITKGNHVGKKYAHVVSGKEIEVTFDTPCGLQIDGEVVEGVTSYRAYVK